MGFKKKTSKSQTQKSKDKWSLDYEQYKREAGSDSLSKEDFDLHEQQFEPTKLKAKFDAYVKDYHLDETFWNFSYERIMTLVQWFHKTTKSTKVWMLPAGLIYLIDVKTMKIEALMCPLHVTRELINSHRSPVKMKVGDWAGHLRMNKHVLFCTNQFFLDLLGFEITKHIVYENWTLNSHEGDVPAATNEINKMVEELETTLKI